ncbi:MAG TPA: GatB/YqeY domain-containing protein [Myxococcota bacterium]|nr:GatB/YqeY domain-containing protein [Myxococcota bacterium]
MAIFDDVTRGMQAALKAKDDVRLTALRAIRAAFLLEMKKDNATELSDEVCVGLLRRLEKQRHESIEAFEVAGRAERAAAERAELAVIESFLPKLADEATTRAWVQEAIAASGATSAKELGKVMGALMKAHKGDVDGNLARRIAGELLA